MNTTEVKIFKDIKLMFDGILDNFQFDSDIEFVTKDYTNEELEIFNNMIKYFELNYTFSQHYFLSKGVSND